MASTRLTPMMATVTQLGRSVVFDSRAGGRQDVRQAKQREEREPTEHVVEEPGVRAWRSSACRPIATGLVVGRVRLHDDVAIQLSKLRLLGPPAHDDRSLGLRREVRVALAVVERDFDAGRHARIARRGAHEHAADVEIAAAHVSHLEAAAQFVAVRHQFDGPTRSAHGKLHLPRCLHLWARRPPRHPVRVRSPRPIRGSRQQGQRGHERSQHRESTLHASRNTFHVLSHLVSRYPRTKRKATPPRSP